MTGKIEDKITSERLGDLLERISIFGGLSEEQTNRILELVNKSLYQDGDQVFAKGDIASDIYIVISGQVRLDFELSDHPLSEITFESGSCFGETSLIGIQPHSASTYAVGATQLLSFSGSDLLNLYEQDLELFSLLILNIARESCRRLHSTDALFLQYSK